MYDNMPFYVNHLFGPYERQRQPLRRLRRVGCDALSAFFSYFATLESG